MGEVLRLHRAEEKVYRLAEDLLEDVLVRKRDDRNFGLARCECVHGADGDQPATTCETCRKGISSRIAGWLTMDTSERKSSIVAKQASNLLKFEHDVWKRRYCVFNKELEEIQLFKAAGESFKGSSCAELVIPVSRVQTIEACASQRQSKGMVFTAYYFQIGFVDDRRKEKEVKLGMLRLKPLEDGDFELVARWMALFLFHLRRFDNALLERAKVVEERIRTLQLRFRFLKHYAKVLEKRSTVNGSRRNILAYMGSFFPSMQPPPSEGELDSSDDESELSHSDEDCRQSSNSFTGTPAARGEPLLESHRWVPPLADGEEEDEIWENERWNFLSVKEKSLVRGWSHSALFPQERLPFSDRVGAPIGKRIDVIMDYPVPTGWTVTTPFLIDRSGLAHARCDADGWRYETQFNALDSKQAKGVQRGKASARWLVRSRRWYRRRVPAEGVPPVEVAKPPTWLAQRGWLGIRGVSTGVLWRSRYCFLGYGQVGSQSNRPAGISVAFLGYFLDKSATGALENNLSSVPWGTLKSSQIRIKPLDWDCRVDDSIATIDHPGRFLLYLSGKSKPRMFNADSRDERIRWIKAFNKVIGQSKSAADTRESLELDLKDSSFKSLIVSPSKRSGELSVSDPDEPSIVRTRSKFREYSSKGKRGFKKLMGSLNIAGDSTKDSDSATSGGSFNKMTNLLPRTPSSASSDPGSSCDLERTLKVLEPPSPDMCQSEGGVRSPSALSESSEGGVGYLQSEPLENLLFEHVFKKVTAQQLFNILFVEDKFHDASYEKDGFKNVQRSPWSEGLTHGSIRKISYLMPRNGPVPQNNAFLTWTISQAYQGSGFQIDQLISNPEVPYGKSFNTRLRFDIVELSSETNQSLVRVSHEVEFLQSTMFKGYIRSQNLREVRRAFERGWVPALEAFIEQTRLIDEDQKQEPEENAEAATFEMPEPLENLVLDVEFPINIDELNCILFQDAEFEDLQFTRDKITEVCNDPWTAGCKVGSVRKLTYLMPRNGPVPKNRCFLTMTYKQSSPGKGYEIYQESSNPEVPFGKTFKTVIRLVLVDVGGNSTRVVISHLVEFSSSTFMKGMIKSGSAREIVNVFTKKWQPDLLAFLEKRKHFRKEGSDMQPKEKETLTTAEVKAPTSLGSASLPSVEASPSSVVAIPSSLFKLLIASLALLMCLFIYLLVQIYRVQQQQEELLRLLLAHVRASK